MCKDCYNKSMTLADKLTFKFFRWLYLKSNEIVRVSYEQYWKVLKKYDET